VAVLVKWPSDLHHTLRHYQGIEELSLSEPSATLQPPGSDNYLLLVRTPEFTEFWLNGVPVGRIVNKYGGGGIGVVGYAGEGLAEPAAVVVHELSVWEGP